jgi:hypothetical protein
MKRFLLLAALEVLALPSTALAVAPNTYIDDVEDYDSAQLIDEGGSGTETMRTTFHGDGIAASSIRFRCRHDGASYASCTSPWSRSTSVGTHTVWVQASNNVTAERDQSPPVEASQSSPRGGTPPPPSPPPLPPGAGNVITGAGDIASIDSNVAVDPDGGFANNGSAASMSSNLFGQLARVTLDGEGNCTSSNCKAASGPIGYRKPPGVHW